MRNRGNVFYRQNFKPGTLKCLNCTFAATTGTFDLNIYFDHSHFTG